MNSVELIRRQKDIPIPRSELHGGTVADTLFREIDRLTERIQSLEAELEEFKRWKAVIAFQHAQENARLTAKLKIATEALKGQPEPYGCDVCQNSYLKQKREALAEIEKEEG